ncbi:hypothetical protein D3C73_964950 [compost metagenome]
MNNFTRSDFRRFLKRNRLFKPRCRDHSWTIFILIALSTFHSITHTIYESYIDIKTFRHLDLHRIIGYKFRFRRHDRFPSRTLWEFVDRANSVGFTCDIRQYHGLHESFNECRFSCANSSDNTQVNIPTGPFGDVLKNVYLLQYQ